MLEDNCCEQNFRYNDRVEDQDSVLETRVAEASLCTFDAKSPIYVAHLVAEIPRRSYYYDILVRWLNSSILKYDLTFTRLHL